MRNIKDALTTKALVLPNAASSSQTSADLDLGSNQGNAGSEFPGTVDVLITVPALNATMLPDTKTLTLQLQNGAAAGPTTPLGQPIVITGAGGAGYAGNAGNPFRTRLPSNVLRYLNLKSTTGANTTDMSAVSVELALGY